MKKQIWILVLFFSLVWISSIEAAIAIQAASTAFPVWAVVLISSLLILSIVGLVLGLRRRRRRARVKVVTPPPAPRRRRRARRRRTTVIIR